MKKLTRESWIKMGFNVLDSEGYTQFSIERIARKLNVTRGSFYHHFKGREAFIRALLTCWETEYTENMLNYANKGENLDDILSHYLTIAASKKPDREVAIRAWALSDKIVAEYQQRVDDIRLAFVVNKLRSRFIPDSYAQTLGNLIHLCLIGGQMSGQRHQPQEFNQLLLSVLKFKNPLRLF